MSSDLLGLGLDEDEAEFTPTKPTPKPTLSIPTSTTLPTETSTTKAEEKVEEQVTGERGEDSTPTNETTQLDTGETAKEKQLQEIEKKFGGRWRLVRSDPYSEYLKAVGVNLVNRKLAASGTPDQLIWVTGDVIYVSMKSAFHNQNYTFKLEEVTENLVEKSRQSVFTSYKDGQLIHQLTPMDNSMGKTQEVVRFISEHKELVMFYTAGSAKCRRYFQKVPDLVGPGGFTPNTDPTPPTTPE